MSIFLRLEGSILSLPRPTYEGISFKEVIGMTQSEKKQIIDLQFRGFGYKKIAAEAGLSVNTVKTYCRRHPADAQAGRCANCGEPLQQRPHKRKKRFCSDACRMNWWKTHPKNGNATFCTSILAKNAIGNLTALAVRANSALGSVTPTPGAERM